jgi:hypothetical protein
MNIARPQDQHSGMNRIVACGRNVAEGVPATGASPVTHQLDVFRLESYEGHDTSRISRTGRDRSNER